MNIVQAGFLGILQGLTEFLPISSSGHLVIAQSIIPDFTQPGVLFDVILHMGTLLAVFLYFRNKLFKMDKKFIQLLMVGSIPAAVMGLLFQDFFESLFSGTLVVGVALIITSVVNYFTDKAVIKKKKVNAWDSLLIGAAQAIAIVPGISRSGLTIFTATKLGIDRKKAAEFSFILSIPAIFGASILQFSKYYSDIGSDLTIYMIGFIFAAISGYVAIHFVIKILQSRKFFYFAVYCAVVGMIALLI